MAERKITNNTTLLFLGTDGTVFDTVVCLTKVGTDFKVDEVDATTVCGPDKSPGQLSGTISFEGQHLLEPLTGKVSGKGLFDYLKNKTTLYYKIGPVAPVDGDVIKTGQGFINGLSDNYQMNTQATFSSNISIQGVPVETVFVSPIAPPAGMWAWYDAALGVTGTSVVTTWLDQSGNSRTLTSPSGQEPELLTAQVNTLPAISTHSLTGTRMMANAVNFANMFIAGGTVFLVGNQNSLSSTIDSFGAWMGAGGFGNAQITRAGASSAGFGSIRGGMCSATTQIDVANVPENTFVTIRLRENFDNQLLCFNNGTETSTASDRTAYVATPLTLFKTISGAQGRKKIAEIIIYDRTLSGSEITTVETYLRTKYAHY